VTGRDFFWHKRCNSFYDVLITALRALMNSQVKGKVLADHKRQGKVFTPPLLAAGSFEDVCWFEESVPEVLWLALLVQHHTKANAAQLALDLAAAALASAADVRPKPFFALTSAYEAFTPPQISILLDALGKSRQPLAEALHPLLQLYPSCPLKFLSQSPTPTDSTNPDNLSKIRNALEGLSDKTSELSTFTQANAIYIAFVNGHLKVASNVSLADFPAIEKYPATSKSVQVAASVRATMTFLLGHHVANRPNNWMTYFWNRGLQIAPCAVDSLENQNG
jgi:hypothetical protein